MMHWSLSNRADRQTDRDQRCSAVSNLTRKVVGERPAMQCVTAWLATLQWGAVRTGRHFARGGKRAKIFYYFETSNWSKFDILRKSSKITTKTRFRTSLARVLLRSGSLEQDVYRTGNERAAKYIYRTRRPNVLLRHCLTAGLSTCSLAEHNSNTTAHLSLFVTIM